MGGLKMGYHIGRRASSSRQGLFFFSLVLILNAAPGLASQHLFLVGGGNPPMEGLSRLSKAAGGAKGSILSIAWAGGVPDESTPWFAQCIQEATNNVDSAPVVASMSVDQVRASKADFVNQLKNATAVFFGGGDQAEIMNLLGDPGFSDLADMLRARYENGMPMGGTSAGMAIMSHEMFTGNEDPTIIDANQSGLFRLGLGVLPGVMVDTHFIIRQRENRLLSYLIGHDTTLGMGIDQDGFVEVTDGELAEVIGNKHVMIADMKEHPGEIPVKLLNPGDKFDLVQRRRISEGVPLTTPAPTCLDAHKGVMR